MDHEAFRAHPFLGFPKAQDALQQPAQAPSVTPAGNVTPVDRRNASPADPHGGKESADGKAGARKVSPGLPPRMPPALPGNAGLPGNATQHAELPVHFPKNLQLERELSCGSDDEFVLIGTPPATPPLRVAWRGAEVNDEGVKLVRQASMPEGFGDVVGKVGPMVSDFMELQGDNRLPFLTMQATVVMELANAMVQHSPPDALSLYVKSLKLLANMMEVLKSDGLDDEGEDHAEEARQLFREVFDKAEQLSRSVAANHQGYTAEEILYECALAMAREAASCEILNNTVMARKRYGCAFVCLNLLRSECSAEEDRKVLDRYLTKVEQRARDVARLAAARSMEDDSTSESSSTPKDGLTPSATPAGTPKTKDATSPTQMPSPGDPGAFGQMV